MMCNFYREGALTDNMGPLQTRVPHIPEAPKDKGPLQTLCYFYRRCAISTDKGPLYDIQARPQGTPQAGSPYRTRGSNRCCAIPTGRKGAPINKGPLHDIQTRSPYWQRARYEQGDITYQLLLSQISIK